MLEDYRRRGIVGEDEDPDVLPFVVYVRVGGWRGSKSGSRRIAGLPRAAARRLASLGRQAYIPVDLTDGPRPECLADSGLAAETLGLEPPPFESIDGATEEAMGRLLQAKMEEWLDGYRTAGLSAAMPTNACPHSTASARAATVMPAPCS